MESLSILSQLRPELEEINDLFFTVLEKRQKLIAQIQECKQAEGRDIWDPKRELILFKKYCATYPHNSLTKDLIFSLVIEVQARQQGNYPTWSTGEHLLSINPGIEYLLNPILLQLRDQDLFGKLELKSEYKAKLKDLKFEK